MLFPGEPATSGDLVALGVLFLIVTLLFSCQIYNCASATAGFAMILALLGQIILAWLTGPFAGEGDEWPEGPVFCVFTEGISCWNMDLMQWLLFFLLLMSNLAGTLASIPAVGGLVKRLCDPSLQPWAADEAVPSELVESCPSLTVLVPCYMPNEQGLIMGTIHHILSQVRYPRSFTLVICYNTPRPLAIEEELLAMDGEKFANPHGGEPHVLRVLRVADSTSKAHNLNAAMREVHTENVVMYDADHYPDPKSLLILTSFMRAHKCACVQGSTYIRDIGYSPLAQIINAEFFITHFIIFPAQQTASGTGFFGGSNALWRSSALKRQTFRHDVQTEDIEYSARMLLSGGTKIRFCPEARSGELPPATLTSLYNQRMRWALGWDQVTKLHMRRIGQSRLHFCRKLGLYYILPARWAMLFFSLFAIFGIPTLAVIKVPIDTAHGAGIDVANPTSLLTPLLHDNTKLLAQYQWVCFVTLFIVVFSNALLYELRYPWRILIIVGFVMLGQVYLIIQLTLCLISLYRIFSGRDGGWVVTSRPGMQQEIIPTFGAEFALGKTRSTPHGTPSGSYNDLGKLERPGGGRSARALVGVGARSWKSWATAKYAGWFGSGPSANDSDLTYLL